jgi:hypothetical protein
MPLLAVLNGEWNTCAYMWRLRKKKNEVVAAAPEAIVIGSL